MDTGPLGAIVEDLGLRNAHNGQFILVVGELFAVEPRCVIGEEVANLHKVVEVRGALEFHGDAEGAAELLGEPCV